MRQFVFSSIISLYCFVCVLKTVSPTNLCSTAGLCCKHRDSECVAQKVFPNHTVDTSQLPCYCDHACIQLDDCCPDYKHFCAGKLKIRNKTCAVFCISTKQIRTYMYPDEDTSMLPGAVVHYYVIIFVEG